MVNCILTLICVNLFYTFCQCSIQIRFGRDLCQQKCSNYTRCCLLKYNKGALVCHLIKWKAICSAYDCYQTSCKRTRRVKCVTLLPDHNPEKHLPSELKKHFCSGVKEVPMKFDEKTVHPKCRLENGVLINEASKETYSKDGIRLHKVTGAATEHSFYVTRFLHMFALSLNTGRPRSSTFVLELAICRNGYFDKEASIMDNIKCSGFFFRSDDPHSMTLLHSCKSRWHYSGGKKSVTMTTSINLGVLLSTKRQFLILIDMDNKIELSRCNKFSLYGSSKFVVKLNDTIKSKVRFLKYDRNKLCS